MSLETAVGLVEVYTCAEASYRTGLTG